MIIRAPFVLSGNLPSDRLEQIYERTVDPAFAALQAAYFDHPPTAPISLLVFKDEASYREGAWRMFGQRQLSIYGYYKPSQRTVVINLDAGVGTLVHELVHALVDFDFPEIPIWLNEGIASLYEQAEIDRAGQLRPRLNWRLSILQQAITEGSWMPLAELAASNHFRGPDEAISTLRRGTSVCFFVNRDGLRRITERFATVPSAPIPVASRRW